MFGENNTDGYNFDTVLQYATFPRVKVLATGHEAAVQNRRLNEDDDTKPGAKSRKDLKYFLDWLYTKGVRHIIRLSVEDSGDSGQEVHSDQVIQAALARFSIEHLDWQKTDLDPETILQHRQRGPVGWTTLTWRLKQYQLSLWITAEEAHFTLEWQQCCPPCVGRSRSIANAAMASGG